MPGASDFVEKPFSPDELRQSVQAVLSRPQQMDEAEEGYSQTLLAVRHALQARKFAEAERKLMKAGTITSEEPWFLNLAGILHESLGRIESARKFYSRAVGKDRQYRPAQINLERLGEIRRSGRSKIPVDFGGDETDGGSEGPSFAGKDFRGSPLNVPRRGDQFTSRAHDLHRGGRDSIDNSRLGAGRRGPRMHGAVRRLADWRPRKTTRAI